MTRGSRRAAVVATVLWLVGTAAPSPFAAPTLDDQMYAIAAELMCPVCGGQTVAESGSQLAEQMRAIIRERLQAGQGRDEIIAYFVGQFGEGVLAAPPRRGGGLTIWLVPPAVLAIGLFVLRRFIGGVRARTSAHPHDGIPGKGPRPPAPAEAEQIRRDLQELD